MAEKFSPEFSYAPDFMLASIRMVESWFEKTWVSEYGEDEVLGVELMRSPDDLRSLNAELTANKGKKLSYPYATMTITSVSPDADKGGMSKKHLPIVTDRSENSDNITLTNQIPVQVGLMLNFRTDNLEQVIRFAHLLMFSAPRVRLSLSAQSGFTWHCGLSIDPNLTVPQSDMGYPSKEFNFETSLILSTWMLRERVAGVIREIRLDVVDSGGVSRPLNDFPTLEHLIQRRTRYTDIVDPTSNRYRGS